MKSPALICLTFILSLVFAQVASDARASGFALKEQSASALGNAFAGATAGAEDVTYMFFNPAALGRLEKSQTAGVLSFIAPQSEFRGGSATTVLGTPIPGSRDHEDAAEDAFLPALYGMWAASDQLRLGLAINTPFGLETSYDRDWIGRYHGVRSELLTVNINPVVAWRVHPMLSIAAGFQAQYAEAELTNAVDFGTIGAVLGVPGAIPASQDGFADLEGDDWGYGWNAGLLFEPRPGTRFGVAYRSKIEHTLEGDVKFSGPEPFLTGFRATGNFVNTDVEADLTTPESWSFGAYQEITPRLAVMAEAALTRWSRFDELRIEFDSAQRDNVTEEDWNDVWFYALGLTYRPSEAWTLRTGVAHDESPVPDATRTPRIPDEDRFWIALGAQWRPIERLAIDAGYTHIWVDNPDLDLRATQPDNDTRGNLSGRYDNEIDIITAQASWRF